jgi:hypothetical protein
MKHNKPQSSNRKEEKENTKKRELVLSSIERKIDSINNASAFYKKNFFNITKTFPFNKNFVFFENEDYILINKILSEFDFIKTSDLNSLEKYNKKLKSDIILFNKKITIKSIFSFSNDFERIQILIDIEFHYDYDKKNVYFLIDFVFSAYDTYKNFDHSIIGSSNHFDELIALMKTSKNNKGIIYLAKSIFVIKKLKYFFEHFQRKENKILTKEQMKSLMNDIRDMSKKYSL